MVRRTFALLLALMIMIGSGSIAFAGGGHEPKHVKKEQREKTKKKTEKQEKLTKKNHKKKRRHHTHRP